jgi:phospholipid N-methyltransferase
MSFLNALSQPERDTLRRVVKLVHMKHHPKDFVTNYEADKIIESIGPEVAAQMIKVGVDTGVMTK